MSANFHEDLRRGKAPPPSERATGLTFAAAAAAIALLKHSSIAILVAGLGLSLAFAVVALAAPRRLRPLNLAWFALGGMLHRIVSPVILGLLFYLVLTPFGLAMRLFRDPLLAAPDRHARSYWLERAPGDAAPESMRNQF